MKRVKVYGYVMPLMKEALERESEISKYSSSELIEMGIEMVLHKRAADRKKSPLRYFAEYRKAK